MNPQPQRARHVVPSANLPGRIIGDAGDERQEIVEVTELLISSRQNISARRLIDPGPDAHELDCMLRAAAAAPDHEQIVPWRFVVVPLDKRAALGAAFAGCLLDRDPDAGPVEIDSARQKAHRAPLLLLAIARLAPDGHEVPDAERLVSLGCAIQNMLLTAHALGFGAGLTSGRALRSPRLRELFRLVANEQPVCFVNVGTVGKRKPMRVRPAPEAFTSTL